MRREDQPTTSPDDAVDLPVHDGLDGSNDLLTPGRNCWRIQQAERASLLVDGAAYFSRLEKALQEAEHSILIIGWDFDSRVRLRPATGTDEGVELGPFLSALAEAKPGLRITLLVWSIAVLHGSSAPKELLLNNAWLDAPNIELKLDTQHPIYGSHHQKFVVIDDTIAFVGGIDLTIERWDTPGHKPKDERRTKPDGEVPGPVHDLQMMVEGPIATALGDEARARWQRATGERMEPVTERDADRWPEDLAPDFENVTIGIARTATTWSNEEAVHEALELTLDLVSAAEHNLYIEAQYLASFVVGDKIAERLQEPDGPDVVILVTEEARGLVEHYAMGNNRDRLLRRLKHADSHDRLRVYYPVVPDGEDEQSVLIHAKLMIADDRWLKVGSSNINNRSFGLDTECDVVVDASSIDARQAVADIRARLLSEHLDQTPERVHAVFSNSGSLVRTIETLNGERRGLRPLAVDLNAGPKRPFPGTSFLDPKKPFEPIWWLRRKIKL